MSFTPKQAIIRKVVDTVIATQKQVRIRGYLPIEEIQNVKFQSESRNANYTIPYLDFSFVFIAPKPRYERIITERDQLGRIIHSKPPRLIL